MDASESIYQPSTHLPTSTHSSELPGLTLVNTQTWYLKTDCGTVENRLRGFPLLREHRLMGMRAGSILAASDMRE